MATALASVVTTGGIIERRKVPGVDDVSVDCPRGRRRCSFTTRSRGCAFERTITASGYRLTRLCEGDGEDKAFDL